jgi:hypothetical protein
MQLKLNWCYAALLISLIGLGWQVVRSGFHLWFLDQDGHPSYTICYACFGSDDDVFKFGMYIFAGPLVFRLLRWTKRISQIEMIVALLCWLCIGSQVLAMDVGPIILTIRLGNRILLAWLACYIALAPVLIALRYVSAGPCAAASSFRF